MSESGERDRERGAERETEREEFIDNQQVTESREANARWVFGGGGFICIECYLYGYRDCRGTKTP